MLRRLYAPPIARLLGEVLITLVLSLTTCDRKANATFPHLTYVGNSIFNGSTNPAIGITDLG